MNWKNRYRKQKYTIICDTSTNHREYKGVQITNMRYDPFLRLHTIEWEAKDGTNGTIQITQNLIAHTRYKDGARMLRSIFAQQGLSIEGYNTLARIFDGGAR